MAGIYIHVPFCKTRCVYCDFYTRTDMSRKDAYVSAVCKEMELRKDYIGGETVETVYFGGGTPSQLSFADLGKIFASIYRNFEVVLDAEITLEANPDDLEINYIEQLKQLPFNRLSIGIQSFDDSELLFLGRRHSARKAKDAVNRCKYVGYNNISIDLMYGLPNQTPDIWERNLQEAIDLDVQHISSYHLIYEQGTKLYRLFNSGEIIQVDETLSVDMFAAMIDKLAANGFEQYEISNFARNSLYSKHNSSYWLNKKYLGLGPAAHSYDGQNRAWNIASITRYTDSIGGGRVDCETEILDDNTRYNDFILTGMRTKWGVNLTELESRFGTEMKNYCLKNVQKYINQELATLDGANVLKLTRTGIFVSDGIMSDLMRVV